MAFLLLRPRISTLLRSSQSRRSPNNDLVLHIDCPCRLQEDRCPVLKLDVSESRVFDLICLRIPGQAVPGGRWLPDSGWPCPPIPAARFRRTSGRSSLLCSPYGFSICRTGAGFFRPFRQGHKLFGSWGAISHFRPLPAW